MITEVFTGVLVGITAYYAYETHLLRKAATEPALIVASKLWADDESTVPTLFNAGSYGAVILDACLRRTDGTAHYPMTLEVGKSLEWEEHDLPALLETGSFAWLVWGSGDKVMEAESGRYFVEVPFVYGPQAVAHLLRAEADLRRARHTYVEIKTQRIERIRLPGPGQRCYGYRRPSYSSVVLKRR